MVAAKIGTADGEMDELINGNGQEQPQAVPGERGMMIGVTATAPKVGNLKSARDGTAPRRVGKEAKGRARARVDTKSDGATRERPVPWGGNQTGNANRASRQPKPKHKEARMKHQEAPRSHHRATGNGGFHGTQHGRGEHHHHSMGEIIGGHQGTVKDVMGGHGGARPTSVKAPSTPEELSAANKTW